MTSKRELELSRIPPPRRGDIWLVRLQIQHEIEEALRKVPELTPELVSPVIANGDEKILLPRRHRFVLRDACFLVDFLFFWLRSLASLSR